MVQIIISFDDQRHIIAKPPSYEILLELARSYFSIAGDTPLFIRYFPTAGAKSVELIPAGYETVSDCSYVIFSLTPAIGGEDIDEGEDDDIQALDKRPRRRDYPRRITISIQGKISCLQHYGPMVKHTDYMHTQTSSLPTIARPSS
jgi:hypothetical protein